MTRAVDDFITNLSDEEAKAPDDEEEQEFAEKLKQAILDQKTRWNSTYLMIVRLIELKEFCEAKVAVLKGLDITAGQWKSLQEMRDVLKPVSELTIHLQHEQLDVTQFVAFWKLSMFELGRQEQQGSSKAAELSECLKAREKPVFDNRLIKCAIYLDKRFSFTMTRDEIVDAKAFITKVWQKKKSLAGEEYTADDVNETAELATSGVANSVSDLFESFLDDLSRSNASLQAAHSSATRKSLPILEAELHTFDSLSRVPINTQIMEFWKDQKQLPVLKEIVLDIISVPVTEVSVERMFSHLNFILNAHRSTLRADLLEDILFLRMNNKFVG